MGYESISVTPVTPRIGANVEGVTLSKPLSNRQVEELHQALVGIITEMERYETRSVQFADAFDAATERWATADREGRRPLCDRPPQCDGDGR